jgi:hypothetical protein
VRTADDVLVLDEHRDPAQGTISRWKVGERLARFVQGQPPKHEWANLSTSQHEAVCAEYLREKHEDRPELPRLSRLLLPAGRTLQDVDLHGLADDEREVFAQVTYHPRGSAPVEKKREALKPYGERGAHLVFFCRGTRPSPDDGVHFVSCDGKSCPGWMTTLATPGRCSGSRRAGTANGHGAVA